MRTQRWFLPIVLLGLCGCAALQDSIGVQEKTIEFPEAVWPEPPLTTRIKFVSAFSSERDIGRELSFSESLTLFLAGRKPRTWRLVQPMDIAVSDDGNRIYVSDFGLRSVILFDLEKKKAAPVGGERRTWSYPFGLALDEQENLYVAEQDTKTVTVIDREGNVLRQFTDPGLERPTDIEFDRERGLLYVADGSHQFSSNHYVKVFDREGRFLRNVGKGKGTGEGYLMFPTYLALGPEGKLYVTDTLNSRVCVFDSDGNFVTRIGERGNAFGMFDKPKGIALDAFGNLYVVDSGWSNVQIFNEKRQVLLFFGGRGAFPGMMRNPTGISITKNNRIYVADYLNNRVDVYELVNTKAEDSFIDPSGDEQEATQNVSQNSPRKGNLRTVLRGQTKGGNR